MKIESRRLRCTEKMRKGRGDAKRGGACWESSKWRNEAKRKWQQREVQRDGGDDEEEEDGGARTGGPLYGSKMFFEPVRV